MSEAFKSIRVLTFIPRKLQNITELTGFLLRGPGTVINQLDLSKTVLSAVIIFFLPVKA